MVPINIQLYGNKKSSIGLTMDIEFKVNRNYDFNNICRSCLRQIVDLNCIFESDIHTFNRYSDPEPTRRICNEEKVRLRLALISCTQIEVIHNSFIKFVYVVMLC